MISTGSVYTPGSISNSCSGFSHKFIRASAILDVSATSVFLNPHFTNDPEDCICL